MRWDYPPLDITQYFLVSELFRISTLYFLIIIIVIIIIIIIIIIIEKRFF